MKVLVIGATGTIGQAVVSELAGDCEVIQVAATRGDYQVDISSSESIAKMYATFPDVDAVVCAAARGVIFCPLAEITQEQMVESFQTKALGQIELVRQGVQTLGSHVSFTLTTGVLNVDPIATGTAAAMVNSAVEGFAMAAAIDMPGQQRINVVSPVLLEESIGHYGTFLPGYPLVKASAVARAYRKSIFGAQTGRIYKLGW